MGQVVINLSSLTLDTMIFLHSLILCGIMAVVSPQTGYYQYGLVEGQCDYVAQDAITALCLAPFVYFYQKSMDANKKCGYWVCYNSENCGPALTANPNSPGMEGRQGKAGKGGKGGKGKGKGNASQETSCPSVEEVSNCAMEKYSLAMCWMREMEWFDESNNINETAVWNDVYGDDMV